MAKITQKQMRFVDEYLIDLNATQAAIRAGYGSGDPARYAVELLNKPHVRAYLEKRQRALEKRTEVTQDKVIDELAKIAFANASDFAAVMRDENGRMYVSVRPTEDLSEEQRAAISCIRRTQTGIEVRQHDKIKALELLGRHLGMFDDHRDSAVPITVTINYDYGQDDTS